MSVAARLKGSWAIRGQQSSVIIILFLVCVLFSSTSPQFLSTGNLSNILLQAAATSIAAIGVTYVIMLAEIDISIGSLMSLAMTIAWVAAVTPGIPGQGAEVNAWVYPVGLAVGTALGVFNALIINYLRINAFIATLATLYLYRGIAWKMVGSSDKPFTDSAVLVLGRTEFLGIGLPVYLTVAAAIVAIVVLHHTPVGRYICAIGGSMRSASETGLPVKRVRIIAYGFAGFCCALAGLITIGRVGVLQVGLGTGFEFTVIAAVVLGGTSLFGGRGSIIGSILGAVLLVVIDNGLNLMNASVYIYDVVKGLILILGVLVDVLIFSRVRR